MGDKCGRCSVVPDPFTCIDDIGLTGTNGI